MKKGIAKSLIGRREVIDIPRLGVYSVDAKVDTGAYTSAIHCNEIKEINKNGKKYISFILLDPSHPQYNDKVLKVENYKSSFIKNSFGQREKRFIVKIPIKIYGELIETEFSLTDRSEMKYPILLGRKFIQGRFLVDVSKYNLSLKVKIGNKNSK